MQVQDHPGIEIFLSSVSKISKPTGQKSYKFEIWHLLTSMKIEKINTVSCWYTFIATSCQITMVKNEIFLAKKGQISNFELQKCYIPQNKAENMYNNDSARKSRIS